MQRAQGPTVLHTAVCMDAGLDDVLYKRETFIHFCLHMFCGDIPLLKLVLSPGLIPVCAGMNPPKSLTLHGLGAAFIRHY